MSPSTPLLTVVEDSDEDFEALERMLRRAAPGVRLERFERGEQMLAALGGPPDRARAEWPSVLIVDLNLPTLSGLETLGRVRSDERLRMLPVVVLSGSRRQEDVDAAYSAGANAYVAKPVDARELDAMLRSLLDWWGRTLAPSRPPLENAT